VSGDNAGHFVKRKSGLIAVVGNRYGQTAWHTFRSNGVQQFDSSRESRFAIAATD